MNILMAQNLFKRWLMFAHTMNVECQYNVDIGLDIQIMNVLTDPDRSNSAHSYLHSICIDSGQLTQSTY